VRSAFFRLAMIAGQGGLVYLAGTLGETTGNVSLAWSIVLGFAGGVFLMLCAWHRFVLPVPASDQPTLHGQGVLEGFLEPFVAFFRGERIAVILAFLLLFGFGEGKGRKMVTPFLLDPPLRGGLGLSTAEVGIAYGTVGVIALTLGGILGGVAIARHGLRT